MTTQGDSAIAVVLRAITDSAVSRAVQAATLRVVETLARFCRSGLASDIGQLRENLLVRDSAEATKELADARIRVATAIEAENQAAEAQRRAFAETRRMEAEADTVEIHAKREADIEEATKALEVAIRRLRAAGGAVLYDAEEDHAKPRINDSQLTAEMKKSSRRGIVKRRMEKILDSLSEKQED